MRQIVFTRKLAQVVAVLGLLSLQANCGRAKGSSDDAKNPAPAGPGAKTVHTVTFYSMNATGCGGEANQIAIVENFSADLKANQAQCDQVTKDHFDVDGGNYAWISLDGNCQKWDGLLRFNELCHRVVESF